MFGSLSKKPQISTAAISIRTGTNAFEEPVKTCSQIQKIRKGKQIKSSCDRAAKPRNLKLESCKNAGMTLQQPLTAITQVMSYLYVGAAKKTMEEKKTSGGKPFLGKL